MHVKSITRQCAIIVCVAQEKCNSLKRVSFHTMCCSPGKLKYIQSANFLRNQIRQINQSLFIIIIIIANLI